MEFHNGTLDEFEDETALNTKQAKHKQSGKEADINGIARIHVDTDSNEFTSSDSFRIASQHF